MAKLSSKEKAISIAAILESFGIKYELKHKEGTTAQTVESTDYVFLLGIDGQDDGYLVHVMADATIAVMVFERIFRAIPGLANYGSYARDALDMGRFVQGDDAQEIKKQLILIQAQGVIEERKAIAASQEIVIHQSGA